MNFQKKSTREKFPPLHIKIKKVKKDLCLS
uniref:Uncharacterized protein n=1 Tax=Caudovirales sp. ct3EF15 TaxID=2826766 RepID=A0A8S5MN13_9CAUD|nr:MAG TPA: hypothetical protein [Caudovirales sp. ct3EF15]DAY45841.1 MAG TPA: hypothetical protein [Caudoviricetes sp.]